MGSSMLFRILDIRCRPPEKTTEVLDYHYTDQDAVLLVLMCFKNVVLSAGLMELAIDRPCSALSPVQLSWFHLQ